MTEILSVVGSIASILGFSLQTFDSLKLKKGFKSSDKQAIDEMIDIFQALVFIRDPAKTWKSIHMTYSALRPYFAHIYELLTDQNGNPRSSDSIAPGQLKNLFQNTVMLTGMYNMEPQLQSSIQTLKTIQQRRKAAEDDYTRLYEQGGVFSSLATSCQMLNNSLDNALIKHKQICDFLAHIRIFNENNQWDSRCVEFVANNRFLCGSAIDNMITYSDGAVMSLLEIYILLVHEIETKLSIGN